MTRSTKKRQALLAAGMAALATCAAAAAAKKAKTKTRVVPKYHREAIPRPLFGVHSTPWSRILTFGRNSDFIVTINITKHLLTTQILPLFETARAQVNGGSPYRATRSNRGRRPQLLSIDILGLALYYLKSRDPIYKMCPFFGLVPSSAYVWLDFALEVLKKVVTYDNNKDFEVRWPTPAEMRESAGLLERNRQYGSVLKGVFGILDGARMPCATHGQPLLENAYWEGFTQGHEVTNLFVWNFRGEIIHAAINFPGSWHDSKVAHASGLYHPKLSDAVTPRGFAILGDSAFPSRTSILQGKIVRSRKVNEIPRAGTVTETAYRAAIDLLLDRAMPSERQSAEWGVRAIKGPFKRLTVPLPCDAYKRLRIILLCAHIYNYRTRLVGLNQIRTVYANDGDGVQPWVTHAMAN